MKFKKMFAVLLCVVMLFSTVGTASAKTLADYMSIDTTNGEAVAEFYDNLLNYIMKYYKYDITREEMLTAAVTAILKEHPELLEEFGKGTFDALDENSMYYNEEEFETRLEDVSGVYVGIGINVHYDEEYVILGEPLEGAPAEGSGLKVGDKVIYVDGINVKGYGLDKVTELIKGKPGTSVNITVLRNDIEYTYTIQRAEIKINPVSYKLIDEKNIGYVKISSFNSNTAEAFAQVMDTFNAKGIKTVVLDLRNNLGGYLSAAISVASYFIPDGKLIATEEYKNEKNNKYHYAKDTPYKFKGVVLINEYSASASELVSGAIKDYKSGYIVGQTSYGKGTVQTYVPLKSNHYMWMTIAEYYTPSHNLIHKVGIEPDYFVFNKYEDFDMSTVTPYEITRVLKIGDTGADVACVKERLLALGFKLEVNEIYDRQTADAVTQVQKSTNLFPYGVADITTQIKINDVLRETQVEVDKQLEKAISIAEKMK